MRRSEGYELLPPHGGSRWEHQLDGEAPGADSSSESAGQKAYHRAGAPVDTSSHLEMGNQGDRLAMLVIHRLPSADRVEVRPGRGPSTNAIWVGLQWCHIQRDELDR